MHARQPKALSRRTWLGRAIAIAGSSFAGAGCGLFPHGTVELSTAPLRMVYAAIVQTQQVLAGERDGEYLATLRNNHQAHLDALRQRMKKADLPQHLETPITSVGEPVARITSTERSLWEAAQQQALALPELGNNLDTATHTDQLSLLASIAACQATHMVLLKAPTSGQEWQPPIGSLRSVKMLQAVLANEHAVIYGYGTLGGHLPFDQREQAFTALQRHKKRRDELSIAIDARGAIPAQSAPGYQLPHKIETSEQARALAISLEESCASHWRAAFGAVERHDRSCALAALTDCATTATRWRLSDRARPPTVPFPGR